MRNHGLWIPKKGTDPEQARRKVQHHMEASLPLGIFYYEAGESPEYYYWYGVSSDTQSTAGGVSRPITSKKEANNG